ncbi:MAG: hypothetical protein ACLR23_02990 [Clostridia bacterium]
MSAELGADSDYSKGEMWIMTFEKLIAGIQPIDEKRDRQPWNAVISW